MSYIQPLDYAQRGAIRCEPLKCWKCSSPDFRAISQSLNELICCKCGAFGYRHQLRTE